MLNVHVSVVGNIDPLFCMGGRALRFFRARHLPRAIKLWGHLVIFEAHSDSSSQEDYSVIMSHRRKAQV